MRKSTAAVGGVLIASGLLGVGGTAFADSGVPVDPVEPNTPANAAPEHNTQATAPETRDLIGVNAPVAVDLHKGVANNLAVHDVAREVAVVGDVVPAGKAGQENQARSNTKGDASAGSEAGGDTSAAPGQAAEVSRSAVSSVVSHVDSTVRSAVNVGGLANVS